MEQIGSVAEYFTAFLSSVQRVIWTDTEILKTFLNGLETYIHREIIFDDPKTLSDAFYLAKYYEERWSNPFSEISKPKLSSQHQIQKSSSTKISYQSLYQSLESAFQAKIQIQNSTVDTREKSSTEHKIRNSEAESSIQTQDQAKLQTADTDFTSSRIQLSNSIPQQQFSASTTALPDLRRELQIQETTSLNAGPRPLNASDRTWRETAPVAEDDDVHVDRTARSSDGRLSKANSGAEDGAVAKGKVDDTDLWDREPTPKPPCRFTDAVVRGGAAARKPAPEPRPRKTNDAVVASGASAKAKLATTRVDEAAKVRRGVLFHCVPSIVAKPPPLTVAVFPWDREHRGSTEKKRDEVLSPWVAMDQAAAQEPTQAKQTAEMQSGQEMSGGCFGMVPSLQQESNSHQQIDLGLPKNILKRWRA
ncbi:uncharacterized protein LOC107623265 [Arachis ipaensis]|uniref:uncharacterized protein LOC107623265 n=1 Tax=Arachis ipaensis TaxID=130454 RepID=UPI0007AFAAB5|nr:uncharacterized protein LOC107623265 [Arachis ipaensis]